MMKSFASSVRAIFNSLSARRLLTSAIRSSMMPPMLPFVSGLKRIISSRRFRNSGRKCALKSCITELSASGLICPFSSMPSSRYWEPMFEVIIRIVFLKSTVLPVESVIRPSSRTCSRTLNTSGCAFSTSSKRTTEYGLRRTASVS